MPEDTMEEVVEETEAEIEQGEAQGSQTGAGARAQELEGQVSQLRANLEERDAELALLREQMSSSTARYRTALLSGAPEVPEELVHGDTVEELDASLVEARAVVEKVAQRLGSQVASEQVPAGSPPRRPPDLVAMSPHEKILYALQRS